MDEAAEAVFEDTGPSVEGSYLDGLLPALLKLDALIAQAAAVVPSVYGPEAAADPFRGLHISQGLVQRLLAHEPCSPTFQERPTQVVPEKPAAEPTDAQAPEEPRGGLFSFIRRWFGREPAGNRAAPAESEPSSPASSAARPSIDLPANGNGAYVSPSAAAASPALVALQQAYDLYPFDLDLILLALAPELDLRYERLYAYLQNDVTRKRPTVDLALNLLCPSPEARLAGRDHFASDASLIRYNLLHLIPDPNQVQSPLLAHFLKLDEQILHFLLGEQGLDTRLSPFCELIVSDVYLDGLPVSSETGEALLDLVGQVQEAGQPLRLYFQGPHGAGKRRVAEALSAESGVPLLTADLARVLKTNTAFDQTLRLVFREAWLHNAILYMENLDGLRGEEFAVPYGQLQQALAEDTGVTILAGTKDWGPTGREPLGVLSVPFPIPGFARRRGAWQDLLETAGIVLDEQELDALAGRFRLTPSQIADAVATAHYRALWRAAVAGMPTDPPPQPTIEELFKAARAQSGHDLAELARKIEPVYTWGDIVLPEDSLAQLREICQRVTHRQRVLGDWGFDRKLSLGKGVNALFAGPSGTGKTMAAEIIADKLGLDLYKIDLSGVVSKYIGETEKNLDRIFSAAEDANAILFFDEADALFGKRSEVRDSHDRYANIEISYLLQKMEEHDGITILATNLRQNLDDSFVRRTAFNVHFPFPDEASRRRIWEGVWPVEVPLADDPSAGSGQAVDLGFLARQFRLSGGNIKNIALAAAFLAAEDGTSVTMDHLLQATRREYQKMGKRLSESELIELREGSGAMLLS